MALDCIAEFERRNCQDRRVGHSPPPGRRRGRTRRAPRNSCASSSTWRWSRAAKSKLSRRVVAAEHNSRLTPGISSGRAEKAALAGLFVSRKFLRAFVLTHGIPSRYLHVCFRPAGLCTAARGAPSRAVSAAAPSTGRDAAGLPRRPCARAQRPPEPQAALRTRRRTSRTSVASSSQLLLPHPPKIAGARALESRARSGRL